MRIWSRTLVGTLSVQNQLQRQPPVKFEARYHSLSELVTLRALEMTKFTIGPSLSNRLRTDLGVSGVVQSSAGNGDRFTHISVGSDD